ncbi:MAG: imidazole glycerol phosphate synthase subunit HisF [Pseudomonadota bacterium]
MLARRIIPCLDVRDGVVVKGVQFRNHEIIGDIIDLAKRYRDEGADELVFYDITASSDQRTVDRTWVRDVSRELDIPFCVAGGIRNNQDANIVLNEGADKISINSPALENPDLIDEFASMFGSQCVVIGIDSHDLGDSQPQEDRYVVYQYTGDASKTVRTTRLTLTWAQEVSRRGAGEIVLNCMNQDGVRKGYDIAQLTAVRAVTSLPLVASGGAGAKEHFYEVFADADVDAALAASVFHKQIIEIPDLKQYLRAQQIEIRP